MRRPSIKALALSLLACASCLDVAYERARRDELVGVASAEDVLVQVPGGLASVRTVSAQRIHLWGQAPQFQVNLQLPVGISDVEVQVDNALFDAELALAPNQTGVTILPLPPSVPTEKRWRLSGLSPGATNLLVRAPDAGNLEPWRFAVFADVQERIASVQDIFGRMNQEPGLRFAIISGDLTEEGSAHELQRFQREMKLLRIPAFATLGNHELGTRDDLFHDYFGRGNFSFDFRGVQFTLLDSASATLAPRVYGWLDTWLAQGLDRLHIVFMHIPPLDPVGTRNGGFASRLEASKLLSLLAAGKVDMTVYGHVHSFYAYSNAGIPAYVTGGGGAIPERFDGLGRHFLVVDVDPKSQLSRASLVRVD